MSNIPRHLDEIINTIPNKPGIYQMKDIEGNIIYIGKSKTLKKRVKSYFYTTHKFEKINKMVFSIHDISFITTDTHLEAQILECALIKKIKPIYNSQFKNHKKYNYLKVENFNRFKPLAIVNEREGENCFGPYRSRNTLLEIIEIFKNIYPITKYEDDYEFTYKILPQPMKKETFENNKQYLIEILSIAECMMNFINRLEKKISESASKLHFEKASIQYSSSLINIANL